MLNKQIQPTTLGGIQRLAKTIKRSEGVIHTKALDIAARAASYENYAHALKQLTKAKPNKSGHPLYFSVFWYDRSSPGYKSGREVLEVHLSKPLLDIASKKELGKTPGVGWFRLASPDHLVRDRIGHSQDEAINAICKAVRTLKFIEATGLKPSTDYEAAYPDRNSDNSLPNTDHDTLWHDPETGQFILVDEPYPQSLDHDARASWAKFHNWHLQDAQWQGMYAPRMSRMYVATDASTGYDFTRLMANIDNLSEPLTPADWKGESSEGHEPFYSPLATTPQDQKRAVAKGTIFRLSSSKTRPMRAWDAPHNVRRPNAVMPIDQHQHVAKLINAVEQSKAKPAGVFDRMSSIKSLLEDWFLDEHDREETDKYELFYYRRLEHNDPLVFQASSPEGVVRLLEEIKTILQTAYIDCAPLRSMIKKIDTSIKYTSRRLA